MSDSAIKGQNRKSIGERFFLKNKREETCEVNKYGEIKRNL